MAEVVQVREKRDLEVIRRLRTIHQVIAKATWREAQRIFRARDLTARICHLTLHPFLFPEPIRQLLTPLEIYVYEAAVNTYMTLVVKHKEPFNIKTLQEAMDNVQVVHSVAFLEEALLDREDRGLEDEDDEELERFLIHEDYLRLMDRCGDAFDEPKEFRRLPESPNLYTPKERKFNWKKWNTTNIMDWVKQFVFNQQHLDLIESTMLDGNRLLEFLDSNSDWKIANWPFGLFIQLKLHMNRLINERNGHKYEIH